MISGVVVTLHIGGVIGSFDDVTRRQHACVVDSDKQRGGRCALGLKSPLLLLRP